MSSSAKWEPLKDVFNRERSTGLALGHSICSALAIQRQRYLYIHICIYEDHSFSLNSLGTTAAFQRKLQDAEYCKMHILSCNSLDQYLGKLGDNLKYDDCLKKSQDLQAGRYNKLHTRKDF